MEPMPSRHRESQPLLALDAMRAGAALAVLISHARDLTFRDAAAQPDLSWPGRAFFALTGLGHQAVIVFFVLSGFLVTGSMLRLDRDGRWSLGRFAAVRLTRLWVVLLPCLLLGAACDAVGIRIAGLDGYGALASSGPSIPLSWRPPVLLGNLFFLQTVTVPVFGSNGALWSLAYEAWYYGLAALVFSAWRARRQPLRAAVPVLCLVTAALNLPLAMLALFPVWLTGAACAWAEGQLHRFAGPVWRSLAMIGFAMLLVVTRLRLGPGPLLDWGLGAATAALIVTLPRHQGPKPRGSAMVRRLAALSYSLYLSHLPLLALLSAAVLGRTHLRFGVAGMVFMAAEIALALAAASAVWWLCERHTVVVREWVLSRRPFPKKTAADSFAAGVAP